MTKEEIDQLAAAISANIALYSKEIMTIDEAAQYLGVKKSYIYKLTMNREIPHYKPGGRNCFFRKVELDEWMTSVPVASRAEINERALAYCMRNELM